MTPDEPYELGDDRERDEAEFPFAPAAGTGHQPAETPPVAAKAVRWGGFFRRLFAFLLDVLVIVLLAAVMTLLSSVGYKVGLSAYGRAITWHNAVPLMFILTWASVFLASLYFVVFHGGEGRTIGKWLLGLRVVGPEQSAIGYGRAFFRWVVMVILAPLGLGFLWILWSSEKRGWHDYLARTWVIRD
ncbi:MAG: RDD family protein [Alphaproteobacteria bacterium]